MFIRNLDRLFALTCLLFSNLPQCEPSSVRPLLQPRNSDTPASSLPIGCDNWGRVGAQCHPGMPFGSLALDELITRVIPGQDRTALVVENELPPVRAHHQHSTWTQ